MNRRDVMALGAGAAVAALLPLPALANVEQVGSIEDFTGGAPVAEGGVTIDAPEIAENGNTVPISVEAPGAAEIRLFAEGNPLPGVASFRFGPLSASQSASTRIRLAGTQNVVAVARMTDGTFAQASVPVKVTIGGCGG